MDGIERDYAGQILILRVDVQDAAGKELSREYDVLGTPTFIFFDQQGLIVWRRVGMINADQVVEALE